MILTDCEKHIFIPARLGSTRLPGKVLLAETGKPLIQHTYEAAMRVPGVAGVWVATADQEIADAVLAFGGKVAYTEHCNSGTERVAQAAWRVCDPCDRRHLVVNWQADEPEIDPAAVSRMLAVALVSGSIVTLASQFHSLDGVNNRNHVKVVTSASGRALFFSRARIPSNGSPNIDYLRHIGIYVFDDYLLRTIAYLKPSRLEVSEGLEQLRWLENDFTINVVLTQSDSYGIDTPEDYEQFVQRTAGARCLT